MFGFCISGDLLSFRGCELTIWQLICLSNYIITTSILLSRLKPLYVTRKYLFVSQARFVQLDGDQYKHGLHHSANSVDCVWMFDALLQYNIRHLQV
jgi:hypothetical protein